MLSAANFRKRKMEQLYCLKALGLEAHSKIFNLCIVRLKLCLGGGG